MSFSKSFLRGLITDITDEQVRALIDEHMESVNGLQSKLSAAESEAEKYKAEAGKVADLEKQLKESKGDGIDWKSRYNAEHEDFEKYKADNAAKELRANKTNLFRDAAKKAGVADKYLDTLIRASASEIDGLELDEKGNVKNDKALADSFKTNWSDFIATTQTVAQKVDTPPTSTGGTKMSKADIMKITDRAERRKAIAENPQLFK